MGKITRKKLKKLGFRKMSTCFYYLNWIGESESGINARLCHYVQVEFFDRSFGYVTVTYGQSYYHSGEGNEYFDTESNCYIGNISSDSDAIELKFKTMKSIKRFIKILKSQ